MFFLQGEVTTAMEVAVVSAEQARLEGRTQLRERTKSIRSLLVCRLYLSAPPPPLENS